MSSTSRSMVEVVVHAPSPQLDLSASWALRSLLRAAHRPGATVVLDLSGVTFVDSSALGVLVAAHRRLQADGGALVVVNVQERVLRVLCITGVVKRLDVRDTAAPGRRAESAARCEILDSGRAVPLA